MSDRPTILVSNDDGFRSQGIRSLAAMAAEIGEVYTVAPDREQSATSHSLTLQRPLRVEAEGERIWAVDGTPTDAVHLALKANVLPAVPDLVVSGINHGANLGDEVTYSGTVAAAMEGCLHGVPSIAFSCLIRNPEHEDMEALRPWVRQVIGLVLDRGLPKGTLLNVNFPDPRRTAIQGLRPTHQGTKVYGAQVVEKTDPRRRKYYWIAGEVLESESSPGSDVEAVEQGWGSVTPVHLDLTDYRTLEDVRQWPWSEAPAGP